MLQEPQYLTVTGFYKNKDDGLWYVQCDEYADINVAGLIGIPLTPEWLERCGLITRHSGEQLIYLVGDQFYLKKNLLADETGTARGYILMGIGYHGLVTKPHVIYVHHLQNIYFWLTSEELTIKL